MTTDETAAGHALLGKRIRDELDNSNNTWNIFQVIIGALINIVLYLPDAVIDAIEPNLLGELFSSFPERNLI